MAMNDLNESVNGSVKLTTYPDGSVMISLWSAGKGWTCAELSESSARWIAERIIADHEARKAKRSMPPIAATG